MLAHQDTLKEIKRRRHEEVMGILKIVLRKGDGGMHREYFDIQSILLQEEEEIDQECPCCLTHSLRLE